MFNIKKTKAMTLVEVVLVLVIFSFVFIVISSTFSFLTINQYGQRTTDGQLSSNIKDVESKKTKDKNEDLIILKGIDSGNDDLTNVKVKNDFKTSGENNLMVLKGDVEENERNRFLAKIIDTDDKGSVRVEIGKNNEGIDINKVNLNAKKTIASFDFSSVDIDNGIYDVLYNVYTYDYYVNNKPTKDDPSGNLNDSNSVISTQKFNFNVTDTNKKFTYDINTWLKSPSIPNNWNFYAGYNESAMRGFLRPNLSNPNGYVFRFEFRKRNASYPDYTSEADAIVNLNPDIKKCRFMVLTEDNKSLYTGYNLNNEYMVKHSDGNAPNDIFRANSFVYYRGKDLQNAETFSGKYIASYSNVFYGFNTDLDVKENYTINEKLMKRKFIKTGSNFNDGLYSGLASGHITNNQPTNKYRLISLFSGKNYLYYKFDNLTATAINPANSSLGYIQNIFKNMGSYNNKTVRAAGLMWSTSKGYERIPAVKGNRIYLDKQSAYGATYLGIDDKLHLIRTVDYNYVAPSLTSKGLRGISIPLLMVTYPKLFHTTNIILPESEVITDYDSTPKFVDFVDGIRTVQYDETFQWIYKKSDYSSDYSSVQKEKLAFMEKAIYSVNIDMMPDGLKNNKGKRVEFYPSAMYADIKCSNIPLTMDSTVLDELKVMNFKNVVDLDGVYFIYAYSDDKTYGKIYKLEYDITNKNYVMSSTNFPKIIGIGDSSEIKFNYIPVAGAVVYKLNHAFILKENEPFSTTPDFSSENGSEIRTVLGIE